MLVKALAEITGMHVEKVFAPRNLLNDNNIFFLLKEIPVDECICAIFFPPIVKL